MNQFVVHMFTVFVIWLQTSIVRCNLGVTPLAILPTGTINCGYGEYIVILANGRATYLLVVLKEVILQCTDVIHHCCHRVAELSNQQQSVSCDMYIF
jgi:hypothetical protein